MPADISFQPTPSFSKTPVPLRCCPVRWCPGGSWGGRGAQPVPWEEEEEEEENQGRVGRRVRGQLCRFPMLVMP